MLDGDDSFVLVGHCGPVDDRTADGHRSLPVGIDPLPGRVAVGGRLLVALEAVAYGRRYRPDPSPGVVFLPGLRLGKLNQARALGLRLGESRQGLVMVLHRVVQDILFPEPELDSFPVRLV